MDMSINTTRCQNHFFASNNIRGGADNHVRIDSLHHIRVSSLANAHNTITLDTYIRLDDASDGIYNQGIRNDHIQSIRRIDTSCLLVNPSKTR